MCSSGLEVFPCLISTNFLRSTGLRFTSSPAIATYTLLQAGILIVRVLQLLILLSFATNCPNIFESGCELFFLKWKENFNFFFSLWERHTLWQAWACVLACGA